MDLEEPKKYVSVKCGTTHLLTFTFRRLPSCSFPLSPLSSVCFPSLPSTFSHPPLSPHLPFPPVRPLSSVQIVKQRLAQRDAQDHGWLLDGYPRSASQAQALEKAGIRPQIFILLEVRPTLPHTFTASQLSCKCRGNEV